MKKHEEVYTVANEIKQGDWIYVHHDGKIFNGNTYPYELRDGKARRNFMIGEHIVYNGGKETCDLYSKPLMASINIELVSREN